MTTQATIDVVAPEEAGLNPAALARLREWVVRDIAAGRHHGATMLVARRGRVALFESLGLSDTKSNRAARTDDVYCIMSLAKSLTAAIILNLVDQGKLTLDSRVVDFLPKFGVRGKADITVHQLMTHTAGTYSGWLAPGKSSLDNVEDIALWPMVERVSAQSLEFRPGSGVYYNPVASYYLLGAIIETVEGRRFRDVLKSAICDVVGMEDTSCGLPVDHPRRVPTRMAERTPGVIDMDVQERLNQVLDETVDSPAGFMFSSVPDLFRFCEALRNRGRAAGGRIFSEAMARYAYRNHTGAMTNEFWDFNKAAAGIAEFPANFALGGGYIRGTGHYLTPCGQTASPDSFAALGSGSTHFFFDPERELSFVYLSSGLYVGLAHFQRCQILADLALAAVVD